MTGDLVSQYGSRLVGEREFALFGEIGRDLIDGGSDMVSDAAELEALLRFVVDRLSADDADAAAGAVEAYVEEVWPIRSERGLGPDRAGEIASAAGVMSRLAPKISHILQQAELSDGPAPAAIPLPPPQPGKGQVGAEPDDGADGAEDEAPGKPEDAASAAERVEAAEAEAGAEEDDGLEDDFANGASIGFEDLCRFLTRKSKRTRRIMLVGMATSGKTFFLQRLAATMRGGYSLVGTGRFLDTNAVEVGRTKRMGRYVLYPPTKRKMTFEIYDMPGDRFREINSNAVDTMPEDYRKSIYALLATVDLFVFVEPALQTLAPALYRQDGDDIEREALAQNLKTIADRADLDAAGREREEAAARAASENERRGRIAIHENFLNAVSVLAKRIELIRRIKPGPAETPARALQNRIEIFERNYSFDDVAGSLNRTIPVPALLLLSRADEYSRRVRSEADRFDRDPSLTLLEKAPDRFKKFADLFDVFAVDFITSSEMEKPAPQFLKESRHAGFGRLLEDWMVPAIRDCRQPGWRKWLFARRWLRHPKTALRLRSYLDPEFRGLYGPLLG